MAELYTQREKHRLTGRIYEWTKRKIAPLTFAAFGPGLEGTLSLDEIYQSINKTIQTHFKTERKFKKASIKKFIDNKRGRPLLNKVAHECYQINPEFISLCTRYMTKEQAYVCSLKLTQPLPAYLNADKNLHTSESRKQVLKERRVYYLPFA